MKKILVARSLQPFQANLFRNFFFFLKKDLTFFQFCKNRKQNVYHKHHIFLQLDKKKKKKQSNKLISIQMLRVFLVKQFNKVLQTTRKSGDFGRIYPPAGRKRIKRKKKRNLVANASLASKHT